jgi:hypothetical protein
MNSEREERTEGIVKKNILTLKKQQSILKTTKPLVHAIFLIHRLITTGGGAMGNTNLGTCLSSRRIRAGFSFLVI